MNYKEAKKIIPKKEFESFESIFMNQISKTPASLLKKRATMARRLRDKYKDLAKYEVGQIRTRNDYEVDTDINDRRARLFQEVINRLEDELDESRKIDSNLPSKKDSRSRMKIRKQTADHWDAEDKRSVQEARRRPQK
jgi:hypothetical protein